MLHVNLDHWSFANYPDSTDLWENAGYERDQNGYYIVHDAPSNSFLMQQKAMLLTDKLQEVPMVPAYILQVCENTFCCVNFW